jgi:diguanylate cyclase (GGDEF)-like protein/putative nucleotidyltransferase with HDIG domain
MSGTASLVDDHAQAQALNPTRRAQADRLFVPLLGATATITSAATLSRLDLRMPGWPTFLMLAVGAAVGQLAGSKVSPDCRDPWSLPFVIAGALLLPPALVAPLAAARHALAWAGEEQRIGEEALSASRTTLSALSASWVVQIVAGTGGTSLWPLGAVAGVVIFMGCSALTRAAKDVLAGERRKTDLGSDVVIAAVGLGLAALWHSDPWLSPVALLPLLAMRRALDASRLRAEAAVDVKTGLFNARHFGLALESELARSKRLRKPLSLLMADLDLLREVNNSHGHLAGDAVLAGVARVLRGALRPYDIGARFGGEEFAVLLPETGTQDALEVAERIRKGVAASQFVPTDAGAAPRVTISIGVAVFPDDASDAQKLLHRADLAVYRAKLQGRNRVHAAGDDPLTNQSPLRVAGGDPAPPPPELLTRPTSGLRERLPSQSRIALWVVPRLAAIGVAAMVLGLVSGVPRWILAVEAVTLVPVLVVRRSAAPVSHETETAVRAQALRAQEVWRAAANVHERNQSVEKLNRTLLENSTAAMETLTAVVDARDTHTAGHSRRVQQISLAIGRELELSRAEMDVLATAALFHDLGKLSVPEAILLKPARLETHEWRIVQRHPSEGARLLERLGFLSDALPAIRHHHERYDGSGYPDGLHGEDIPLGARIINVADALDAMLTARVYRPALTPLEALKELRAGAGTQFCPRCVAAIDRIVLAEFAKGADPTSPDLLTLTSVSKA